ncbi:S41 family peptidase [Lacimicrobium alkaliphilum]|nr:S41 family peptidase [Lacimicrobium alkaliphilum]
MSLKHFCYVCTLLALSFTAGATQLLRQPTLHDDTLVFTYANDLWKTTLKGGPVHRLTSYQGSEDSPVISPDGKYVAFSGEYNGNKDVYLVSINGGDVRRLTFHPGNDEAVGWTPDGKQVLFRSPRYSAPRNWPRLFTVSIDGGNPQMLPMQRAFDGDYNASGEQVVFRRAGFWDRGWRNYRGGQNQALRIINLDDLKEYDLPFNNDFEVDPLWSSNGDIYFLSNRSKVTNVFKFSPQNKQVQQVTRHDDYDVMGFTVDGDNLVYEYLGDLYIQRDGGAPVKLNIDVSGDFFWAREGYVNAHEHITAFNFSPRGKRAVFSARGDIFTVPVEHGSPRALSNSSGSREHAPAWSDDGQFIAWFTDESGEYELQISDQFGKHQTTISLAGKGFYQDLHWSPDSKRLLFTDSSQQLWVANRENQTTKIIDTNPRVHPEPDMMPSWSPDSRYILYTKQNVNMFRELHLYSVEKRKSMQLTHGMAETRWPVWDASGEYIYFFASVDYGPKASWLDMSSISFTPDYHLYAAAVNDDSKPLLPLRSDEEEVATDNSSEEEEKEPADDSAQQEIANIEFDLAGFNRRIQPVTAEAGHFSHLASGKDGKLFFISNYKDAKGEKASDLMSFDPKSRKVKKLADKIDDFRVSVDGKSLLVKSKSSYRVIDAAKGSSKKDKTLKVELKKRVNFQQEWQQIFREAWRYQRDYLYVDNFHGADWDAVYDTYKPLVESVRHPVDMTYLLDTLGGEVSIGHSYTSVGDKPDVAKTQVGLLGVDMVMDEEGVRLAHIYTGESFFANDNVKAPLGKVAHLIDDNSYLLAVNGEPVDPDRNIYSYFEGTLSQVTTVTIGHPDSSDTRTDYEVKPIKDDNALRKNHWVEQNRQYVEQQSKGKLAYVWVPNTGEEGYNSFNRYFYAQADKPGVIIDERFNHGGFIADHIIDALRRELNGFFNNPFSPDEPLSSPGLGIWGSKVMLINEVSGSGGDMLPYMFRYYGLGKLVGKRTWGGLVGIWGVPAFVDGGRMTAPRSGFYDMEGNWQVENEGVAPDINVEQWTRSTAQGRDPQLDKAIEVGLEELETYQSPIKSQPEAPVRVPVPVQ